jgi:glyoxylase-like metal-dependent hydrolase (beta-lactamase superfamily II)
MKTALPTLPRSIRPRLHWLGGCHLSSVYGSVIHVHHSNYLLDGERTLLVDTGFPSTWPQVDAHLDQLLGDRPLDYVCPTHSEIPHSGNLSRLLMKYPAARVVGDMRDFHLYFPEWLDRMDMKRPGDVIDLGEGVRLTFLTALFKDLPNTLWAYEESQRAMFVADGFAYAHHPPPDGADRDDPIHYPGECALTSSELPPVKVEQMSFILKAALNWSRYVDIRPVFAEVAELFETRYPTEIVLPAHGNVIARLEDLLPVMREAHNEVYEG